jgi:hypothetical protein
MTVVYLPSYRRGALHQQITNTKLSKLCGAQAKCNVVRPKVTLKPTLCTLTLTVCDSCSTCLLTCCSSCSGSSHSGTTSPAKYGVSCTTSFTCMGQQHKFRTASWILLVANKRRAQDKGPDRVATHGAAAPLLSVGLAAPLFTRVVNTQEQHMNHMGQHLAPTPLV